MMQMNGGNSDHPGTSLSSQSSVSDIVVRNPPTGMPSFPGSNSIDMNNIGSVSLETLGLDMSLEEAVSRVRELARENAKLREDAQKNNNTMKQQYETLSDWKRKWEQEREEVKKRHDQARAVVTDLREQLKQKEQYVVELQLEIAQQDEKKNQKAELLTLEQTKSELEKKCADYMAQINLLEEELQSGKSAREEHCVEIDKYIKIVRENEQRIRQLDHSNKSLLEEVNLLKNVKAQNENFQQKNSDLSSKVASLNEEVERLRNVADLAPDAMRSYVIMDVPVPREQSDSVPFSDESPSSLEQVTAAAKPVFSPTMLAGKEKAGKQGPSHSLQNVEVQKQTQEKTMSDVVSQLQEERTKVSNLQGDIHQKNQEMEALHKKVHKTEELLAEIEYRSNLTCAKLKVDHQKEMEEIKLQMAHLTEELEHTRATPQSFHSQSYHSSSEEDAKNLRVQVTSLVGELQEANDKVDSTRMMYEKQKQRIQMLEDKLQSEEEQREVQRARDDELIETLRVTINNLESRLTSQQTETTSRKEEVEKVKRDYQTLVQHYRELTRQNELTKKQFEQLQGRGISADDKRRYEIKVDNLTAQLMTAEESMQERTKKLMEIDGEKMRLAKQLEELRAENDLVAVHKAQAEVFKADFEAERRAREESHTEKERLQEEVNQLHLRNQQLQEEVDSLSQNQITQMQIRHGNPNSPYQRFGGAQGGYGGYPVQAPPEQNLHARNDATQGRGRVAREISQEEAPQYVCPKCDAQCPDLDNLQLHVLDCIV